MLINQGFLDCIAAKVWFGTRGPQVRTLSPRLKSRSPCKSRAFYFCPSVKKGEKPVARKIVIKEEVVKQKLDEFLSDKKVQGVSPKTLSTYECHLKRILPLEEEWENVDWNKVVLDINSGNIAPYTKVSYLRTLKCFQKHYDIPITYKIPSIETVKETYTDEELKKLTAKPTKPTFAEYRTYAMIMLALDTGIRSASLRNIKISDVQDGSVIIRHTKTKKVQMLPYGQSTGTALRTYMRHRGGSGDDLLFCDIYGNPLSENAMKNTLVRFCKKKGIEHHSWHMLRHTFAKKFLLECGESPFMLQQMLGHSSLEMSRHYCNIFNADLIKGYKSPIESMHKTRITTNRQCCYQQTPPLIIQLINAILNRLKQKQFPFYNSLKGFCFMANTWLVLAFFYAIIYVPRQINNNFIIRRNINEKIDNRNLQD